MYVVICTPLQTGGYVAGVSVKLTVMLHAYGGSHACSGMLVVVKPCPVAAYQTDVAFPVVCKCLLYYECTIPYSVFVFNIS